MLEVRNLKVRFTTDEHSTASGRSEVRAVDDVSFSLKPSETLGIVGESGSGKSVTNLALMGLIPAPPGRITGGEALFHGQDLLKMTPSELADIRGNRIAMIFQDPMTSLNPFLTIAEQMTEITRRHFKFSYHHALNHAIKMLEEVGIPTPARRIHDYPHQMSGGMRQRIMIAMALSCNPEILIADEPTTALDVTIQAQILNLLEDLQAEHHTAIILITHDLGVVAHSCQHVAVMYAGKIVEKTDVHTLFKHPKHPYSVGLMNSMPRINDSSGTRLAPIPGQPPHLADLPRGCAFQTRCDRVCEKCSLDVPQLQGSEEHLWACHNPLS